MRDLHGRFAGGRIAVKGEETVSPEGLEDLVYRRRVDVKSIQFTTGHTSPGVLAALAERDESEEDLFDHVALSRSGAGQEVLRARGQRTCDAADLAMRGQCEPVVRAAVEEFGERVLK